VLKEVNRGRLAAGKITYGESLFGRCIERENNTFTNKDTICIRTESVTGFVKGEDGYNDFDLDVFTENESGSIVSSGEGLYGTKGHAVLLKNVVEDAFPTTRLRDFDLGKYTYRAIIYDKISGKSIKLNMSFNIVNQSEFGDLELYRGYLKVGEETYDEYGNHQCISKNIISSSFTGNICFEPIGVEGFQKFTDKNGMFNPDQDNLFNMDITVKNRLTGIIVYQQEDFYGNDGMASYFFKNRLEGYYITVPPNKFSEGLYEVELKVYDKISKKQISLNGELGIGNLTAS
jgi:hypothetical protein